MRSVEELLARVLGLDPQSLGTAAVRDLIEGRLRARGTSDEAAYLRLIESDKEELEQLLEAAVVHETWFFREPAAFDCLRDFAQKRVARGARTLRVLSVPCSTGEEPYSIAMTLLDAGFGPAAFSIDALDVSEPAGYLEERARFVAEPMSRSREVVLSAVVFEVGGEAYALEGKAIVEVTEARAPHRVPRRTNTIFRGLVNVHGQLELCFSLAGLLGLEAKEAPSGAPRRVLVTELEGRRAVLLVDRVRGAQRFEKSAFCEVPASSARRRLELVRSVLVDGEHRIGLLHAESVRVGLEESLR